MLKQYTNIIMVPLNNKKIKSFRISNYSVRRLIYIFLALIAINIILLLSLFSNRDSLTQEIYKANEYIQQLEIINNKLQEERELLEKQLKTTHNKLTYIEEKITEIENHELLTIREDN